MSTELGAFAVLSSLLLYLTDLISSHPQVQNNKAKWLENMGNKLNARHERQRTTSGIRPTKFQLLQSRFMNNNREHYRKKTREVGKLVIKEKPSANRNGLSSIVSKLERRSLAEESPPKTPQEKVKWVGSCGKNTVKNILKKFIAAEEKELKEKEQLMLKKKALNNNLPKIINKNSVLSKLKERFEHTSNICSTIEVKALLPCTGENKSKKGPGKKAIRKAQIGELKADLRTTTHFNGPQPQHVVGATAPTPKFCVATEISHPWSWATKAKCTVQHSDYNSEAVETKGSQKPQHVWPGGNRTPEGTAYEGQQEGRLQNKQGEMPKVVTDDKDTVENNVMSGSPGSNLDRLPPSCESQSPAGCIPTLSKDSLGHKKNVIPPVGNVFSSSGKENAAEIISKEHLSTTCPPCSPTERACAPSCQEIKRGEIPGIPEGMCRPTETEIELAEPIRDPPFASQKSFPEQKLVENIPPFHTPVAQASCNTTPPGTGDLQSSVEPPAVDNVPPLKSNQENAPDCTLSFSDAVQNKEKLPQQKETFPNPTKRDHASTLKQKEPRPERGQDKPPDGGVESELLPQKPHNQQSSKDTSRPGISKHTQAHQAPTSNFSQKEKTDHIETKMCYDESEQHLSPVSSDVVVSSCATAIENTDKCKSPSVNEVPNPENEAETEKNQADTTQVLNHELNHELHNSRPAAEKCHSSSLDHSGQPVDHTADINRPWRGVGKFQKLSSLESIKKESCAKDHKVAIPNAEKLLLPSPNELLKPTGTPGGDNKSTHNLPSCNDVNNDENNAAEDKGARPQTDKHRRPSAKELEKHESRSSAGATSPLSSPRKSQMPLVNESGEQENKKVVAEEKSQKSNLPSHNEMLMQECNSDAGKRKTPKAAVQPAVPSTVDRRGQEGKRAGGKSPTVESKKVVPRSKTAQKSITNNLAKDGDGNTTENSITQTLQSTPSEHKGNSPGVLHSLVNAKYQAISKDPAQHRGVRAGDENTMEEQRSPLKEHVRQESDGEGRNAKDSLTNDKMSLPGAKVKSESKTGKKQDNSSNSGQSQLPVKNGLSKSKQHSARETNTVGNLKKDQKPSSKELKSEQTNPAVEKPKEMSLRDSGKPRGIPKGEKDDPGNCLLPLPDVKWESLQNKAEEQRRQQQQQQQQPQLSKAYVKSKPGIRDEKHQHCHSERQHLPSANDMEMQETKAVENKSTLDDSEKCRAPMRKHDRPLCQKKAEYKFEAQPTLGSSDKTPPAEQKSTQPSASKYQILSSQTASRPGSEDAQTSGAGGVNENKARTKLGSSDKSPPAEQKSTQPSARKYQILSSRTASRPGSEDAQTSGAGGVNENKARTKLGSSDKSPPAEQKSTQPSASKYQILSSRIASRPGSEDAQTSGAGGMNENKARLVNMDKYIAESYSEEPTHTSFKPIVIRAIDTIKLDN